MNIDSDRSKAFFQLAVDKTFSKASKSLGISQSALSQKIAKLENELETTLAVRSSKKVTLTDAGHQLIRYYKTKLELDESLLSAISSSIKGGGHLRIAGFSSITRSILLKVLRELSLNKEDELKFNLISKEVYELPELLLTGEVDFILSTKEVQRENIINLLVGEEELVNIIPLGIENKELPFIDHDEKDTTTFSYLKEQKQSQLIKRNFLDDIYTIIEGVENGLGQAVVSKHLVSKNNKVQILKHKVIVKTPIYLCYFDKVYYSTLHKSVISTISSSLPNYL